MDPFLAEIRIFSFNFAPTGWAFCNGQLLPISQNTALFALLGTVYGGDGKSTFALPDMEGSAPMHPGQGPGLSDRVLGEQSGVDTITLLVSEIPIHSHALRASDAVGEDRVPGPDRSLARSAGGNLYCNPAGSPQDSMAPQALGVTGGGLPHNNMMPYLTMNFCIALQGVFPQRP